MDPVASDATAAWDALEEPWRVCLSLAWSAYGAGTIPVGAVLVDARGVVVAEGRNRVYEPVAPPGQLAGGVLAHAELNALAGLDPEHSYEDHVLYSSLESCLLCVGAAVMATVGTVRYAGADPYGGGESGLIGVDPRVQRLPTRFEGPRRDAFGMLASALLPAFYLNRDSDGLVVGAYEQRLPGTLAVARALLDAGAPAAAAAGVPLSEALPRFWRSL